MNRWMLSDVVPNGFSFENIFCRRVAFPLMRARRSP
jgi:hypothetical protein